MERSQAGRMKGISDVSESKCWGRKSESNNSIALLYVYSKTFRHFRASEKGNFRIPSKAPSPVFHAKMSLGKDKT